ncbi:CBS domain-containing protein CBSX3, mitochondrial [Pyrus x bretschneideri]|uniref:CBS domain-containing protein CBSX3, mitochondrial n=1 Tax=Pyrus x bretschneideri TaxID=225117 RepID=UPI00051178FE|nr:CBS domain-containing protein CBSX3, mitochondrial [Pyrus x bretschneideri]XP_048444457.1 CBS domain-containing protein CBSX3, mitochondrial [Pyrus x bretschneideri]
MQGISRAVRSCQEILKSAILQHSRGGEVARLEKIVSRLKWVASPPAQEKGLENVTVADVLATKGNEETGPWLWCHTNDAVIDAVKNMAKNNIGSLLVLKPGEHQHIAGIITERDYLRKVIAQERSPIYTRVGEIMTNENELITVTSDMNVLQAMQLMTENHIRHAPVIDGKLVGMISIKDVVRAVVEQQSGELKRLTGYIKGEYY